MAKLEQQRIAQLEARIRDLRAYIRTLTDELEQYRAANDREREHAS
jgi:molecular chaperone GrpE (heat shock protein)